MAWLFTENRVDTSDVIHCNLHKVNLCSVDNVMCAADHCRQVRPFPMLIIDLTLVEEPLDFLADQSNEFMLHKFLLEPQVDGDNWRNVDCLEPGKPLLELRWQDRHKLVGGDGKDDMETPTTLTLTLPPETERKLRACAAASGQDVAAFALEAIQEKLQTAPLLTQDDRLASLRQEFRESGMTDDELYDLLKTARDEVRREKRQRQSP